MAIQWTEQKGPLTRGYSRFLALRIHLPRITLSIRNPERCPDLGKSVRESHGISVKGDGGIPPLSPVGRGDTHPRPHPREAGMVNK